MKKKLLPLLLAGLLLLSSVSCSAGGGDPGTLIYASFQPFGVDPDVKRAILRFNLTHRDVQIEVRDYWGEDAKQAAQGRRRLLTEINTGKMPDILDLGYDCQNVPMLPYRKMVSKGYLEDLWPYIENDPELGRGAVIEAPLKAAEIDGGLYFLFDSFRIDTLTGPMRVVGDRTSWTLADLWDAFAAMPGDATVLEYCADKESVFFTLMSMNLESYVDWKTGECSFDSEGFRRMLEFIGSFPDEVPWPSDVAVNIEIFERRRSGRQMLTDCPVRGLLDLQQLDAAFGEPTAFVGYPMEDGSMGSAFNVEKARLAISSYCKNKEAAWELVRQLLLPKHQNKSAERLIEILPGDGKIPINLADYERIKEVLTDDRKNAPSLGRFIVCPWLSTQSVDYHPATEEEVRRFEEILNGTSKIRLCDSKIIDIVREQAGAYFAGDWTLDKTVDQIQRRVKLYVDEQR